MLDDGPFEQDAQLEEYVCDHTEGEQANEAERLLVAKGQHRASQQRDVGKARPDRAEKSQRDEAEEWFTEVMDQIHDGPLTEDIVREYMAKDARIRLYVQETREGKTSAINVFLANAQEKDRQNENSRQESEANLQVGLPVGVGKDDPTES